MSYDPRRVALGEDTDDSRAFFCWDLLRFIRDDKTPERVEEPLWWHHEAFALARRHECPYRSGCARYAKGIEKHGPQTIQTSIIF